MWMYSCLQHFATGEMQKTCIRSQRILSILMRWRHCSSIHLYLTHFVRLFFNASRRCSLASCGCRVEYKIFGFFVLFCFVFIAVVIIVIVVGLAWFVITIYLICKCDDCFSYYFGSLGHIHWLICLYLILLCIILHFFCILLCYVVLGCWVGLGLLAIMSFFDQSSHWTSRLTTIYRYGTAHRS